MEDVQDHEGTEEQSLEESAIITELRNRDRAKDKEIAKLRAQQAEVEAAVQSQRSETAKSTLDTLGFGEELVADVLGWVEGDMTAEAVMGALESRGIPLPEGTEKPVTSEQSASVSDIGQKVADSAAGVDSRTLDERLDAVDSNEELLALMTEANLNRSHS